MVRVVIAGGRLDAELVNQFDNQRLIEIYRIYKPLTLPILPCSPSRSGFRPRLVPESAQVPRGPWSPQRGTCRAATSVPGRHGRRPAGGPQGGPAWWRRQRPTPGSGATCGVLAACDMKCITWTNWMDHFRTFATAKKKPLCDNGLGESWWRTVVCCKAAR